MQPTFNGLGMGLGALSRLSSAKTRSICAENPTGEKGKGGMAINPEHGPSKDLGQGWKVRPCIAIQPGETVTVADIAGPGALQHLWMTAAHPRFTLLRIYWDDEAAPSVETPFGDFFCNGWGVYGQLSSAPVCLNPGSGMNCWWEMPFRRHCRVTLENIGIKPTTLFYQIDYTLTQVPADAAYFHAQFRRVNPLPYKEVYTILDGVRGQGHYVGTSMAWGVNNNGWWGEGEIKFYLDGDADFPTICGTGTEDYFLGSYNFDPGTSNECTFGNTLGEAKRYQPFTTPWSGMHQVIKPDGVYQAQMRFGLYRWHVMDPIRFEQDLRVTIQALGWRAGWRYLPLQDDIASVAYWYQAEPHALFPALPGRDALEVV
jgi:hypothetical protein